MNKNNLVRFDIEFTNKSDIKESINALSEVLDGFMDNSLFSGLDLKSNNSNKVIADNKSHHIIHGTNTEMVVKMADVKDVHPVKISFKDCTLSKDDLADLVEIIESSPFAKGVDNINAIGIESSISSYLDARSTSKTSKIKLSR
jgi:hypothetical protein